MLKKKEQFLKLGKYAGFIRSFLNSDKVKKLRVFYKEVVN
jgi:hypothetical protein